MGNFDLIKNGNEGLIIGVVPRDAGLLDLDQAIYALKGLPCKVTLKAAIAIEIETMGKFKIAFSDPPVLYWGLYTFQIREKDVARATLFDDQTLAERVGELRASYMMGDHK